MTSARRYVVLGAGAIGGSIGGLLRMSGADVEAIARGAQLDALAAAPLVVATPSHVLRIALRAFAEPSSISWSPESVVLLCTKSQDSEAALDALRAAAGPDVPLVCAQNGVINERLAAQRFERVYAMMVFVPATFLEPGRVCVHSEEPFGVLELGRYPSGADELARSIARDLQRAGFDARVDEHVMRAKNAKLVSNLGNVLQALAKDVAFDSPLVGRITAEALACYQAAAIDSEPARELASRCAHVRDLAVVDPDDPSGERRLVRAGGSSWQSLARRSGTLETAFLNGEIVRIGREHGVPTPVNAALVALAERAALERWPPGSLSVDELERAIVALSAGATSSSR